MGFVVKINFLPRECNVKKGVRSLNLTIYQSDPGFDEIVTSITVESYEIVITDECDYLSAENFGRLLIPGKPNIPSKIFAIAIPPEAEVTGVNFETGEEIVFPGTYNILPYELPQVIGKEDPVVREREVQEYLSNYESVYKSDEIYPESIIEFVRSAGFRKYNLVDVRVTPFSYKPFREDFRTFSTISTIFSYSIIN